MVFKKEKMIARLKREGRFDGVTENDLAIMDNLDGCKADANCWHRVIYGMPLLWVIGKDGNGEYVNEDDCE